MHVGVGSGDRERGALSQKKKQIFGISENKMFRVDEENKKGKQVLEYED